MSTDGDENPPNGEDERTSVPPVTEKISGPGGTSSDSDPEHEGQESNSLVDDGTGTVSPVMGALKRAR